MAGRDTVLEDADISLRRVLIGRSAQSQIFLGLRGTGKTVLLNEVRDMTDRAGYVTSFIETPENNSLAELLYPQMRQTLRRLSVIEAARGAAITAMRALRGFASVFKISLGEVEIGVEPDPGIADSGNLENDLPKCSK